MFDVSPPLLDRLLEGKPRSFLRAVDDVSFEIERGQTFALRAYGWIYKIMEVDGRVDVREAKFLLYALKDSDIELDEVIRTSLELPQL